MKTDVLHTIPDTVPHLPISGPVEPAAVRHFVLTNSELAQNLYSDIDVSGNVLAVTSSFPIRLFLDGVPVSSAPRVIPIGTLVGPHQSLEPAWLAGVAGGLPGARLEPSTSFVVRREFATVTIAIEPSDDHTAFTLPGVCHLWIGRNVEDMGFGLPVSHMIGLSAAPAAALAVFAAIRPSLHGNNAAGSGGDIWIPSRTELYGISMVPTWTAAVGVISRVSLQIAPSFELARWHPRVEFWDFDFGISVEVSCYQTRKTTLVDDRGSLTLTVNATQSMATLDVVLRMRSWL